MQEERIIEVSKKLDIDYALFKKFIKKKAQKETYDFLDKLLKTKDEKKLKDFLTALEVFKNDKEIIDIDFAK